MHYDFVNHIFKSFKSFRFLIKDRFQFRLTSINLFIRLIIFNREFLINKLQNMLEMLMD